MAKKEKEDKNTDYKSLLDSIGIIKHNIYIDGEQNSNPLKVSSGNGTQTIDLNTKLIEYVVLDFYRRIINNLNNNDINCLIESYKTSNLEGLKQQLLIVMVKNLIQ